MKFLEKTAINSAVSNVGKIGFQNQLTNRKKLTAPSYVKDDMIFINGILYSKKQLTLEWFRMSNDAFFDKYGFNFNPHEYPGLYEWGRTAIFGE